MKMLQVEAWPCQVTKRNKFPDQSSGGMVYQCTVVGLGLTKTFNSESPQVAEHWPNEGEIVELTVTLEANKEGLLKMGAPVFAKPAQRSAPAPSSRASA